MTWPRPRFLTGWLIQVLITARFVRVCVCARVRVRACVRACVRASKSRMPILFTAYLAPINFLLQKGGVDAPIVDLLNFINVNPRYVHYSSVCSPHVSHPPLCTYSSLLADSVFTITLPWFSSALYTPLMQICFHELVFRANRSVF